MENSIFVRQITNLIWPIYSFDWTLILNLENFNYVITVNIVCVSLRCVYTIVINIFVEVTFFFYIVEMLIDQHVNNKRGYFDSLMTISTMLVVAGFNATTKEIFF